MPLFYQRIIMREHLRANPGVLFVFGDNVQRRGFRGQASQMRGERNAIGVATKWSPRSDDAAFFNDADIEKISEVLFKDLTPVLQALTDSRIVVWPSDGIGTGLSQLPARAPLIWSLLESTRENFETL